MPASHDRIKLSREDIGILMSYATRPERFTDDVIERLCRGITHMELVDTSAWLGLPKSTATRLFDVSNADKARTGGRRVELNNRYRRAIIGLLGLFVLSNAITNVTSEQSGLGSIFLTAAAALTAYLVYALIVRFSSS
jgi:hypothetical protein